MHPRSMKRLAVAFAGGSALLLACAVHDDTNFPNPPQPTHTTPPVRNVVVDSGVVTLRDDAGGGPSDIGGGGELTPDAGEEPDVAPEIEAPASGGPGDSCDVFNQATCKANLGCFPNPTEGTQTCQPLGTNHVLQIYSFCTLAPGPTDAACIPGLVCVSASGFTSCTALCHYPNSTGECTAGNTCKKLGILTNVGYCG
jgi:hypothetical protein